MSVDVGNRVKTDGISREAFTSAIKNYDEQLQSELLSIFNNYAARTKGAGADDNMLDEAEQVMARSAFAALDKNQNNEVNNGEYNKGNGQNTFMDASLKTVGKFFEVLNTFVPTDIGNEDGVTTEENQGTLVYDSAGQQTEILRSDDTNATYQNNGNEWIQLPGADNTVPVEGNPAPNNPDNPTQPVSNTATFESEQAVKNALIDHIFGMENSGLNASDISDFGNITVAWDESTKTATVEFGDKTYVARTDKNGHIGFYHDGPDNTGSSLRYDISRTDSNDQENHLHNHGDYLNAQSTYNVDTGEINNQHDSQRAVSQTQTFASMLMNGNTNTTLTLDNQQLGNGKSAALDGQTIVDTIAGKDSNGVTLKQLVNYLKANHNESNAVEDATGARKFARNVDIDLKDIANVGALFAKFNIDKNAVLDKDEMDALLQALKSRSTTEIANEYLNSDTYVKPEGENPTPEPGPDPTVPPQQTERIPGDRAPFIRNVDRNPDDGIAPKSENDHRIKYYQDRETGVRTVYTVQDKDSDDRVADMKGNIAVNVDHFMGIGQKDFIYIEGLETQVDAEIMQNKNVQGDNDKIVIKVKDRHGNITYRAVSKNNGKYTLDNGTLIQKGGSFITRSDAEGDIRTKIGINDARQKIPPELSIQYDNHGKNPQITYRGRVITPKVAETIVIKYNATQQ